MILLKYTLSQALNSCDNSENNEDLSKTQMVDSRS